MTRRILLLLALIAALAACSSDGDDRTIEAIGMRFVRDEVHVPASQPVTLRIVNRDGYAHAFDIDEFDIHRPLAAWETVEITFTPEQAGSYTFYCGSPGHMTAGMNGVLVVEP
ncbi:MAG: cupredoxin domain-containing protein [Caldilineales bacterium]|nr:cupredoxin domain-containing protein [Caldilineales bacterium]